VLVSFIAIWGAIHVRGPFADQGSLKGMLSLQLFLVLAALPFMVLAALAEERENGSRELKESEERFRLAAQAGSMYAYEWDVATDAVTRSTEHAGVLGLSDQAKQLTRQQLLASVHPDDRAPFVGTVDQVTPENPATQISYRILRPDGSVVWLEKSSRAFFDERGKVLRTIGMVADITQRKLAEEALAGVGRRLIEAQEQERTRIARELHDDINQRIALLTVQLEEWDQHSPSSEAHVRKHIGSVREQLTDLGNDVQALSHRLHSSKLEYLGLAAAVSGFCRELSEQHTVVIDFRQAGIPHNLPKESSLCLFRVLQEALQNAVKHSGERHFKVELSGTSAQIQLTVKDLGVGFDPQNAFYHRGIGLVSMRERLQLVGGELSIQSEPGHGTTIDASVPLRAEACRAHAAG
jgi:PAS domain S-box-containing protein